MTILTWILLGLDVTGISRFRIGTPLRRGLP
jgi:hypothetical protein